MRYVFFFFLNLLIILALLALLKRPEIGQNNCLRHGIENYFELNYYHQLF